RRAPEPDDVRAVLAHLADRVSRRLRAKGRAGRTLTVAVRFTGMRRATRSLTLPVPVCATLTLTAVAVRLARAAIDDAGPCEITRRGVWVASGVDQAAVQLELGLDPREPWRPGSRTGAARGAVGASVDAGRARFGADAVGYLPAVLRRGGAVPDEFRGLAERDL